MGIIQTHDVTLYGQAGDYDIILRPLSDDHLPLLYRWNADPEVLYWTEGADVRENDADTVHMIYGKTSQAAFCFLIEVNGVAVGECWLQKMNLKTVLEIYPEAYDVRRIDMMIAEKTYWDRGIGTALVRMLVDFAFHAEQVDVLHGLVFDFNERSARVFTKNGFQLVKREPSVEAPNKAKEDLHFRLTRQEYIDRRRVKAPPERCFELPLSVLRPSQLYVSEGKLRLARDWFDSMDKTGFDPIPVKKYNGEYLMTDGHTRGVLAAQAGWDGVPVVWDDDALDMLAYAEDVRWCDEAGIQSALDLSGRIVSHADYERLWHKRCLDMTVPPSYGAIVTRYGGLDGRHRVIVLTDGAMLRTARLIQSDSVPFVKSIDVINLDEAEDYTGIYALGPEDLLILHLGIESWTGRHKALARAFDKPEGVAAKYICIRPTVTPQALLEGVNTPLERIESILRQYGSLRPDRPLRVTAKSGTDITLTPYAPFPIPHLTHQPGANAYLPPAEVSYSVRPGSARGVIVADVTVGELRVFADLIDPFGLVDGPVTLRVDNGELTDISGGAMAQRLKAALWSLPESCRKIIELGIGLSDMTPTGIIGIDESIAGTCHFGLGNGSGNDAPIHLDVVISDFAIE